MWSTVINTSKTPLEVTAAIAAEIREARPALWIFSEKYAGPPEGQFEGTVTDGRFQVSRAGVYRARHQPVAWVKGVIIEAPTGSQLSLDIFVPIREMVPAFLVSLATLIVVPPFALLVLPVSAALTVFGLNYEYAALVKTIRRIVDSS
jgi:hypothetical protein